MSLRKAIIIIEPVTEDIRIGSVFNHIFKIMYQTEQTELEKDCRIIWDFSKCRFLHPFYIGSIAILKRQYGERVFIKGISPQLAGYLDCIYFSNPLEIKSEENDQSIWESYKTKSYLPLCLFKPGDSSSLVAQQLVQRTIRQQLGHTTAINSVISYLFGELIDNITEHSQSKEGFLFCQYRPSERCLYVMILDTGRSVFASYASDTRYHDLLTAQESSGLLLALKGKSTKDRPDNENRGYGISRSRKLIVEGLGGEFFILSGSAFARHDSNGEIVIDLPGDLRWNGTAILLKIPACVPENFNLYSFIS